MYEPEARLPVHLWIDAQLSPLSGQGIYHYIQQRGDKNTGLILLKLSDMQGECKLLIQQRDLDGKMGWMNALRNDVVPEMDANSYIERSIKRDPDLWVIEIEDRNMANPFEGKMII